jgi:hypothetical protein
LVVHTFSIDGNHFDKAKKLRNKCEGLYEEKIEGYLFSEQTLTQNESNFFG